MTASDRGGFIDLPRSVDLDPVTAGRITAAALTRLVVVAGPTDCGKTTLLTSLYDRFLRVPTFGEYCFAGSETLVGFEQRCHPSRVASGRGFPVTERTPTSAMLHLRVRKADLTAPARDLLLADVDGVTFQQAKDSSDACLRLGILKRADRLVLGVDGSKVSNPARRFVAAAAVRDFLRRACDVGVLGTASRVDIVVMKWDTVEALALNDRAVTTATLDRLSLQLREDFTPRLSALRFGRVAARPDARSTLDPGYGLADLLPAWVEERGFSGPPTRQAEPLAVHREIDRFRCRAPAPAS